MTTSPPIIEVQGLWKRYGLPVPAFLRKAARAITRASERTDTLPWALKDINFSLKRGENLGIIGRNGAGKSTLLKILSGVTPPTEGDYRVEGRVFPMIELQAGINPDLTGRDNIMLLGAVAGFSTREISKRYRSIAEFSELEEWLDRPVRMYSSGMQARLAFSVAIHADADVLLIDEVLGVGDYRFRKKCIDRLEHMRLARNTSIIFVSHNPYQVQRLCDKVLMLDKGVQTHLADAATTLTLYFASSSVANGDFKSDGQLVLPPPETREGSGRLRVTRIEQIGAHGRRVEEFSTGTLGIIRVHYESAGIVNKPNISIQIIDSQGTCLLSFTFTRHMNEAPFPERGHVDCEIDRIPLLTGDYFLKLRVAGETLLDSVQSAPGLRVTADAEVMRDTAASGLFYASNKWTVVNAERSDAVQA